MPFVEVPDLPSLVERYYFHGKYLANQLPVRAEKVPHVCAGLKFLQPFESSCD
jgi:hypothetical protein